MHKKSICIFYFLIHIVQILFSWEISYILIFYFKFYVAQISASEHINIIIKVFTDTSFFTTCVWTNDCFLWKYWERFERYQRKSAALCNFHTTSIEALQHFKIKYTVYHRCSPKLSKLNLDQVTHVSMKEISYYWWLKNRYQ